MYRLYISKLSSLGFDELYRNSFDADECYIQKFSSKDIISFQVTAHQTAEYYIELENDLGVISRINPFKQWVFNGNKTSHFIVNSEQSLNVGDYRLYITNFIGGQVVAHSSFRVLPEDELADTVLLKYTNRTNHFDTIFADNDSYFSFDFRFEGGIKISNNKYSSKSNFFRDQDYTLKQLSSDPQNTSKLTIGTNRGVPMYIADKVNRIFSLTDVEMGEYQLFYNETTPNQAAIIRFDGNKYIRSGDAVEKVSDNESYPLSVYELEIEGVQSGLLSIDLYPKGARLHQKENAIQFN